MQALGLFRTVALLTLGGRAAMLLLMLYLLRHFGLQGLATARVCYGLIAISLYLPLFRYLSKTPHASPSITTYPAIQERVKS